MKQAKHFSGKGIWWLVMITLLILTQITVTVSLAGQSYSHFPPGLVYGLRHTLNQDQIYPGERYDCYAGGDLGAPSGHGYRWCIIPDRRNTSFDYSKLPPGIVFGLKHTVNQQNNDNLMVQNRLVTQDYPPLGLMTVKGGDRGAPNGQGYWWYESTGSGDIDWSLVEELPRYTIVGLKHTLNQPNKIFYWRGQRYDPANQWIDPPPGFERRMGGDRGAPSGHGYCWYEKVTGPRLSPDLMYAPHE